MRGTYLREQESVGVSGFSQLEDKVMKTAAQLFGGGLLPYAGVKGRTARIVPTEHIRLEVHRLEESFNFTMRDGSVNMRLI